MKETAIAAKLLLLLASGGTIERALTDLPIFKTQIELVFEKMKRIGRCSATEMAERAVRLREAIRRKNQAIRSQDFDVAANARAEECAVFESFGLGRPTTVVQNTILRVSVDEQIQQLSALLCDTNAA